MVPAGHHVWRLSKGGEQSLGLSCTQEGLYLGLTPRLKRCGSFYLVRPQAELERLFKRAYGDTGVTAQTMPGLAAVASALSQKNLPLAQIAALHLRLPDLPDITTRARIEAEDRLIKSGQDNATFVRAWDDAAHPRTGTSPNPGCFAPKPGSRHGAQPTQTAQRGRGEREPEESLDPTAPVRQAVWDARTARLRQLDLHNPNLVYVAPPGAPPSREAIARLDAELSAVTARVAKTIANGHAFARHAREFPGVSDQSQFSGVIERVISNPSSLVKPLNDDRTAFYEASTNSLVIVDAKRADLGTAFRPSGGADYVNRLR